MILKMSKQEIKQQGNHLVKILIVKRKKLYLIFLGRETPSFNLIQTYRFY